MNTPVLSWDYGTAYDFFISLRVLHDPGHYGLRPSWAAGVRSRLSVEDRDILEKAQDVVAWPMKWIHSLPVPKDTATALWVLSQIDPKDRLPTLLAGTFAPLGVVSLLQDVVARGAWTPEDQDALREAYQEKGTAPRPKTLISILDLSADAGNFGDRYLSALRNYQRVFFSEEEKHVQPVLKSAVQQAQELAAQVGFDELVESLSHGVRLGMDMENDSWILVPSYWTSPLVFFDRLSEGQGIFIFGGRPADVSLVPGEQVPDRVLRGLKTLADPTRMRILRYLAQENITPAEIARRLRLRAPTVTHHLNALRLAGLVYLTIEENQRHYAARLDAIDDVFAGLKGFLADSTEEDDEEN